MRRATLAVRRNPLAVAPGRSSAVAPRRRVRQRQARQRSTVARPRALAAHPLRLSQVRVAPERAPAAPVRSQQQAVARRLRVVLPVQQQVAEEPAQRARAVQGQRVAEPLEAAILARPAWTSIWARSSHRQLAQPHPQLRATCVKTCPVSTPSIASSASWVAQVAATLSATPSSVRTDLGRDCVASIASVCAQGYALLQPRYQRCSFGFRQSTHRRRGHRSRRVLNAFEHDLGDRL
ncbi:MAG: hypothetical protein RL701_4232, partial [Pseudomonadota bacterium]